MFHEREAAAAARVTICLAYVRNESHGVGHFNPGALGCDIDREANGGLSVNDRVCDQFADEEDQNLGFAGIEPSFGKRILRISPGGCYTINVRLD